ncbi:hypothetical protein HYPSUDRAFT_612047 [Hypholoma sublateritium FD-334 SS-4]|uniref:Fungal-type protein kinase domain-containing protein n=1 Tax=Hypholoma sublateritium (strain FD-334 SS-4) TaxID=945553 RepID=A0A0D2L775_HYPSF|nr:hypothetical protein HYPSUDRAFT_612047 [Hypholoma sublateritium FD-334 SS-4]
MAPLYHLTDEDVAVSVRESGIIPNDLHRFVKTRPSGDELEKYGIYPLRLHFGLRIDAGCAGKRTERKPHFVGITHFASKHELISVLIDAVKIHKSIVKRKHTLSDISIENIVISTRDPSEFYAGGALKGAHVPGDHSKIARVGFFVNQTAEGKKIVHRDPAASRSFKSLDELICADTFRRQPHHDFESLFYMLLWICINYDGPKGRARKHFVLAETPLHCWYNGESDYWIGVVKRDSFHRRDLFETEILGLIAPYFEDLKPLLRRLWRAFFGELPGKTNSNEVTHGEMIGIFQQALDVPAKL